MKSNHIETNTIHAGKVKDKQFGALSTPIYQTSTYVFDSTHQGGARFSGDEQGYIYGRLGNPTVRELEQRMASLEGTDDAAALGSGMGAVSATIFAIVNAGDHIVASNALYGCSYALLDHKCRQLGIDVTFVDITNEMAVRSAIKDNTKMLYAETPINPNLVCVDLDMIARVAKEKGIKSVIDNTFMSPVLQRPVEHGIDLIIHSATKYLNGHGDVIAGIVCGDQEMIEEIKLTTLKDMGAVISPHDAWLIIRGLKTLHIRVERHCQNAQKVAEYLEQHPSIKTVYFPGLPSHDGHRLIGHQMKAGGGVMAFEIDGDFDNAVQFMDQLKMCKIAVSLGDAETLIQHPASMTHSPYEPEDRRAAGISDTLVRLSVGLEHVDDIIEDLHQGLSKAFTGLVKTGS
ncbi:methionine gamma-lyase [Pleionea mediterranea]|uniref:L-methionine gamma-lyase n=1 Tax=Pleionea mediterranea TaxID=523701 RepID=A0A316FJ49_9GAMM|nr:methionine gamma-lyase [Pleionea mediterranea]PWK47810.1 methionine-gamma-lyase [Pleionea mediterranea]